MFVCNAEKSALINVSHIVSVFTQKLYEKDPSIDKSLVKCLLVNGMSYTLYRGTGEECNCFMANFERAH